MMSSYNMKKQPELVRSELLKAAIELSSKEGLSAISIQAVADLAGVTKGGLMHHFPSKQKLVEGAFHHLLKKMDEEIDALIEKDGKRFGCFTRAYIRLTFWSDDSGDSSQWSAITVSVVSDPTVRKIWYEWLKSRLNKHKDTDSGLNLEIARLAADGAWLNLIDGANHGHAVFNSNLEQSLIALTQEKPKKK